MSDPVVKKRVSQAKAPSERMKMPSVTQLIDDVNGAPAPIGTRPPMYRPQLCDVAYKICLMGATAAKLGEVLDVEERTIKYWLDKHPAFRAAVNAGREAADAEIAASLYGRAKGFSMKTIKVMLVDGKPHQEEIVENFPPDTNAAKFWLMNRQPTMWREKMEVDNTHRVVLTEEQINERLMKLLPPE